LSSGYRIFFKKLFVKNAFHKTMLPQKNNNFRQKDFYFYAIVPDGEVSILLSLKSGIFKINYKKNDLYQR